MCSKIEGTTPSSRQKIWVKKTELSLHHLGLSVELCRSTGRAVNNQDWDMRELSCTREVENPRKDYKKAERTRQRQQV
jgi:hypothetical protein